MKVRVTDFLIRFGRAKEGASAVVLAIAMPVLIGFVGFGVEAGYWYFSYQNLQTSADIGSYTAAMELRGGASSSLSKARAKLEAERNGFVSSQGTMTINIPPSTGAYAGDAEAAEVIVTRTLPRLLTKIIIKEDVEMSARGVAEYQPGNPACVLALDPTVSGALSVAGNTTIDLTGCEMVANSMADDAAVFTGNSTTITDCVSAFGGVDVSADLTLTECAAPVEGAPVSKDPYANFDPGDAPADCSSPSGNGKHSAVTLEPGNYCGGLTLGGEFNLDPGVYFISGDLHINAQADVSGEGVTFVMTDGGQMSLNGGASINISAPSTGDTKGVLFYGDRDDTSGLTHSINGNSSSAMNGVMYFPEATLQVNGTGDNQNGCTHVIAKKVRLNGSSAFGNNCSGYNTEDLMVAGAVRLVE